MLKTTFLGHSCFLFTDGKSKVIVDPFLNGNPQATVKPDEVDVDYILATHGHADHLGDAVEISKRAGAPIIGPNELAIWVTNQGATAHNMHIGGSYNFEFGRVKLTIAHHGSSAGDSGLEYTGNPCGFVFEMGGKKIYYTGDTGLFLDMKLIGDIDAIDLMILPIGDNFTMGIDDASRAVRFVNPKTVIPMHYKTWDIIDAEPDDFKSKLNDHDCDVVILSPNEALEL